MAPEGMRLKIQWEGAWSIWEASHWQKNIIEVTQETWCWPRTATEPRAMNCWFSLKKWCWKKLLARLRWIKRYTFWFFWTSSQRSNVLHVLFQLFSQDLMSRMRKFFLTPIYSAYLLCFTGIKVFWKDLASIDIDSGCTHILLIWCPRFSFTGWK